MYKEKLFWNIFVALAVDDFVTDLDYSFINYNVYQLILHWKFFFKRIIEEVTAFVVLVEY